MDSNNSTSLCSCGIGDKCLSWIYLQVNNLLKPYQCDVCDRTSYFKGKLETHKGKHAEEKPQTPKTDHTTVTRDASPTKKQHLSGRRNATIHTDIDSTGIIKCDKTDNKIDNIPARRDATPREVPDTTKIDIFTGDGSTNQYKHRLKTPDVTTDVIQLKTEDQISGIPNKKQQGRLRRFLRRVHKICRRKCICGKIEK